MHRLCKQAIDLFLGQCTDVHALGQADTVERRTASMSSSSVAKLSRRSEKMTSFSCRLAQRQMIRVTASILGVTNGFSPTNPFSGAASRMSLAATAVQECHESARSLTAKPIFEQTMQLWQLIMN